MTVRDVPLTVLRGVEGAAGALGTPATTWPETGTVLASWEEVEGEERDGAGGADWARAVRVRFPSGGLASWDPALLRFRHPDGTDWEVLSIHTPSSRRGAMVEARLARVRPGA